MELFKQPNHRNDKYLKWIREQNCIVSLKKADCAHHIRLGTNGGSGIKPSDYFCIPLKNEFHTTGNSALHLIGEASFFEKYNLLPKKIIVSLLARYLSYDVGLLSVKLGTEDQIIAELIDEIESKKEVRKVQSKPKRKKSITSNPVYIKSVQLKKLRDKELRKQLKNSKPKVLKVSITDNEYYQKAKEAQRKYKKEQYRRLKELRS